MDVRKGSQLPTISRVLPYSETKGPEAIGLYNQSGRTAQEWQLTTKKSLTNGGEYDIIV